MRPCSTFAVGATRAAVLLEATVIAVADELAGAAELVMGKANQVPAALIRGYRVPGRRRLGARPRDAAGARPLPVR